MTARKSKKLSIPMTRRELTLGWIYLMLESLVIPGLLSAAFAHWWPEAPDAYLNFAFYLLNFLAVLGIFHTFLGKSLTQIGKRPGSFFQGVLVGFACYYAASQVLGWLIGLLEPDFYNVNDAAIGSMTSTAWVFMAVGTVALVPPVEECFYRGLVFRGLYSRSRVLAYAVSTLAFCAIHVVGYLGSYPAGQLILCFVQYIPAGLCLAWAYETADTIAAPILMHAAINAIGMASMR